MKNFFDSSSRLAFRVLFYSFVSLMGLSLGALCLEGRPLSSPSGLVHKKHTKKHHRSHVKHKSHGKKVAKLKKGSKKLKTTKYAKKSKKRHLAQVR